MINGRFQQSPAVCTCVHLDLLLAIPERRQIARASVEMANSRLTQ